MMFLRIYFHFLQQIYCPDKLLHPSITSSLPVGTQPPIALLDCVRTCVVRDRKTHLSMQVGPVS